MIDAWLIAFVANRALFLILFPIVALPIRFVFRVEWNRAALIASVLCAVVIGGLSLMPMQTHAVRLDMPRPVR